jgi:hypothetical protein
MTARTEVAMEVSARRGLSGPEIEFSKAHPDRPECARLAAAWRAWRDGSVDPAEFEAAIAAYRAVHGQPVGRADMFYAYMAVTRGPGEDVLMLETRHVTMVLAGYDALAVLSMQPDVEFVRSRMGKATLRAYTKVAEGDDCIVFDAPSPGGVPPYLYAFICRHADGHETTMAFANDHTQQPMLATDPGFAAEMRDALLARFRAQGRDIVLRRYALVGDADEREVLARCAP